MNKSTSVKTNGISDMPKGKCSVCGGTLRAIGLARSNGAPHFDWATRTMHKKCYLGR